MKKRNLYLVCYDVADDKRLRAALKIARKYATNGKLPKSSQNKQRVAYFHRYQQRTEQQTRYYIHSLWETLT